jgi:hypothetical protein
MKKIQAGLKINDIGFDFHNEGFIIPTLWEVKGGLNRKLTVSFNASGLSERDLRKLGWCGVDDERFDDLVGKRTLRYYKNHSIRQIMAGDNSCVYPKAIRIDDYASPIVDLEVKRNLQIMKELYLDLFASDNTPDLTFEVVVWNRDGYPIERYTIECPWADDVIITEFSNNGMYMSSWPVEETLRICAPKWK